MKTTLINRTVYVLVPVLTAFCVVLLFAGVVKPAYAQVLVSNTGQTRTGNYNALFNNFAQEFTTGSNIDGYKLTSIEVIFESGLSAPNVKPSVKINLSNNGVPGGTTLGELTKSGGLTGGLNRFEAPADGIDLEANTSYVVWFDSSAHVQFAAQNPSKNNNFIYTTSDAEDSGASAGWSMGDSLKVKRLLHLVIGRGWQPITDATWTSFHGLLMISVNGSALNSYDSDSDGLIDIGSLAQLNAVRWDLNGDGAVDNDANATAYAHGFPNAVVGLGCPDNDCTGYELMADLDFDTNGDGAVDAADSYWNDSDGWVPIGSSDNEFVATFEGNGHTIDNLNISRENTPVGLFGAVGTRGQVRNVGVRKVTVYGYGRGSAVGGLVGINTGSIVASYATGTSLGEGLANTGGLVGINTGSITASYAAVLMKSLDGTVGGLVGVHGPQAGGRAIITASYATGDVSRTGLVDAELGMIQGVGGLVGINLVISNGGRGIITASYATGNVENDGDSNIGGLVGLNLVSDGSDCRGIITASYATGAVMGNGNIGGLVGLNLTRGSSNGNVITASYAIGAVTGSGNVGGLVGQDSTSLNANSSINNSYWNTETSGQATSEGGIGKTTAELVTPTRYSGIYFNWNLDLDGNSTNDNPWDFGTAFEYPVLRVDFDGDGDVDADDIDPQRPVTLSKTTDFNGDGRTNFADFFLFVDAFGGTDARFDLDGSGTVDAADFFLFVDAVGS